jgi:hypothetical protein
LKNHGKGEEGRKVARYSMAGAVAVHEADGVR